ncbi:MAG: class I SAM-dependent methyltransferase [Gemmatimonadota bacterium]
MTDGLMVAWALLATVAAAVFVGLWLSYRRRLYTLQGRPLGGPIPTVQLDEFDPLFRQDDLGPTTAAEVAFIGSGRGVRGGASDRETWVLAALARDARLVFEFGTATGKTAYLLARNAGSDARVVTLTLAPGQHTDYAAEGGDSRVARQRALKESAFERFRYHGTSVEDRVDQHFGDSKALDPAPWAGQCDLVFVDGSHAASYVRSDTEKALELVAPGGLVLWHDYRGPHGSTRDVWRELNRLSATLPLVHLAGTSLVAYRRPEA